MGAAARCHAIDRRKTRETALIHAVSSEMRFWYGATPSITDRKHRRLKSGAASGGAASIAPSLPKGTGENLGGALDERPAAEKPATAPGEDFTAKEPAKGPVVALGEKPEAENVGNRNGLWRGRPESADGKQQRSAPTEVPTAMRQGLWKNAHGKQKPRTGKTGGAAARTVENHRRKAAAKKLRKTR